MGILLFATVCWIGLVTGAVIKEEPGEKKNELMELPPAPVPRASLKQIFHDDFNSLNKAQWVPDASITNPHNEFEMYSPENQNCYTRGGVLYLRPTLTSDRFGGDFLYHGVMDAKKVWGHCKQNWYNGCLYDAKKLGIMPPVMSCMVRSEFSFKYGRLEFVAQMPKGDWLWPALWLMPKKSVYGIWPQSGEIDVAETTGNLRYGDMGVQRATASLYLGNSPNTHKHLTAQHVLKGATYGDKFYKYTLDWTSSYIKVHVDDVLVFGYDMPGDGFYHHLKLTGNNIWRTSTNAPYDQEFYMLMNVAVGGTEAMFFDWVKNEPYPMPWGYKDGYQEAMDKFWKAREKWYPTWHGEQAAMKVDKVTVWQY